ncbi:MAG: hypothetical protein R2697_20065 [Ilumatobacteraceae bacterium]
MTWIQMSEWEFPGEIRVALPTPLSHAATSVVWHRCCCRAVRST